MGYAHMAKPGNRIKLDDIDPDYTAALKREEAEERTKELIEELCDLQEILYAAGKRSLLVVLQGRDTSGKDGTIRSVFGPLNSQGCEVASFKVPTQKELAHDFLWRIHLETPELGHIKVFNRSHYEDVMVVRVHRLVGENVWRDRYNHINNFESQLTDSGTIIRKFYLHIDKDEQEKRLLKREEDKTKYWKLSVNDWKERKYWDDYTSAYEDAINNCFL